ncbi:hypothetical protein MG293_005784 [Ovis ammon polii]|uniref:Uncharacterized protein n=1 Tax=Ovis ammon polii TaxID=230172 RepID=A0AAD4YF01_OVIAM|nr:hypothetical protein MG293_005784 [Ovis ammon polii]
MDDLKEDMDLHMNSSKASKSHQLIRVPVFPYDELESNVSFQKTDMNSRNDQKMTKSNGVGSETRNAGELEGLLGILRAEFKEEMSDVELFRGIQPVHQNGISEGKVPHAFIPEPLEINEKHDLEGKESYHCSVPQYDWKNKMQVNMLAF